jgi:hypothetical protein
VFTIENSSNLAHG